MLKFEVDETAYKIQWTDLPYDVLYMVYVPCGPLVQIVNGQIRVQEPPTVNPYVVCPKKQGALTGFHDVGVIPGGRYYIRLCTDETGRGEVLAEKTVFLGHRVVLDMFFESDGKSSFGFLYIRTKCFIPRNQIWLTEKTLAFGGRPEGSNIGIRIPLPDMKADKDLNYYTGTIIPSGGCHFIDAGLSDQISGCIRIIKHF